jgi:DNA polymerase (family 10)
MDKRSAAFALEQIASFMELKGENTFRVRAFVTAARVVRGLPGELDEALADGSLAAARGIGPATLQIVTELVKTGSSSLLEELREQIPAGLIEMLSINGLGVARIRQIHETLGIDSLPDLEAAARDGRLARLPRFGPRTAENLLKSIAFLRQTTGLRLSHNAVEEANAFRQDLARIPGVTEAVVAGEVRRRSELVREIVVVLVAAVPPEEIFKRLRALPGVHEFSGHDERRVTLRFAGGSTVQIVVTTPVNAGTVLVQATGSPEHLAQLSQWARTAGHALDGAALWKGSSFIPTADEATFYRQLGLEPIPPELREGMGEIEAAAQGRLPALVERGDLKGLVHCHTNYSDGSATVEQLAVACRAAGYSYVGITDHSVSAAYAGGLTPDDLARQGAEIDEVNSRLTGIRVLKGIEADILADGRVDYDEATLSRLDFVIASIHSRFNMNQAEMTERMLAAMDNPCVTIIGHPTGRLLLARNPYPIDLDAVMDKALERGIALEMNADPHRLDLDWRILRRARDRGIMVSIGADAHSVATLRHVDHGIGIARKGWLTPANVLNALPLEEFLSVAGRRVAR